MGKDSEFGTIVLGVIGGVGMLYTAGGFSSAFDQITANSCSGNGTSDTGIEIGQMTSENPNASTVATGLTTTVGGMQATSSEPDAILVIFNKDAIPYTKIERNARRIYHSIKNNKNITGKETAIITESEKGYVMLEHLIYDKFNKLSRDNLEVLERVLERIEE